MRQVYGVVPGGVPPGVWGEWKPPHYRSNTHTHTHIHTAPDPLLPFLPPSAGGRRRSSLIRLCSARLGYFRLFVLNSSRNFFSSSFFNLLFLTKGGLSESPGEPLPPLPSPGARAPAPTPLLAGSASCTHTERERQACALARGVCAVPSGEPPSSQRRRLHRQGSPAKTAAQLQQRQQVSVSPQSVGEGDHGTVRTVTPPPSSPSLTFHALPSPSLL